VPDALGLAGSLLTLELDASGEPVTERAVPALPGLSVDASALRRIDGRCANWSAHWQGARREARPDGGTQLVLAGALPAGCTVRARLQLLDRAELTERLLRWAWTSLGGRWSGRTREPAEAAEVPPAPRLLARRQTRPWGEMLRHLNKQSDNEWTRLLYLELGAMAEAQDAPARVGATTAEAAEAAVRRWFVQQGIATEGLVLDNGSGLSRRERITPQALAELVRVMGQGPHAADFLMSLPTVGVDGTMRLRLREGPASGRARLKTGTLRDVAALAGVAYDDEGRPWAVAMMVNHPTRAARGRAVMDAWVDHVARHGVHPAPLRQGPGVGPLGDGP
jgi:D-alanyl-D-alanine carboxypeptidase/D-alanyl-D-alanine-endopeptidase (penicillin-binding protein 4)